MERMLFEAFFWNPAVDRPAFRRFRVEPEFRRLLGDWGRHGDHGVIAENTGAAWFRLWNEANHSYGYVDEKTAELAIAVERDHRSKGIGRALLRELIALAREKDFEALSLSVSPLNPAVQLYESEGFRRAGGTGSSITMVLPIADSR